MLARQTLEDHNFTGDTLRDFGLQFQSSNHKNRRGNNNKNNNSRNSQSGGAPTTSHSTNRKDANSTKNNKQSLSLERLDTLMPVPAESLPPSECSTSDSNDSDDDDCGSHCDIESRLSLDTGMETVKMSNTMESQFESLFQILLDSNNNEPEAERQTLWTPPPKGALGATTTDKSKTSSYSIGKKKPQPMEDPIEQSSIRSIRSIRSTSPTTSQASATDGSSGSELSRYYYEEEDNDDASNDGDSVPHGERDDVVLVPHGNTGDLKMTKGDCKQQRRLKRRSRHRHKHLQKSHRCRLPPWRVTMFVVFLFVGISMLATLLLRFVFPTFGHESISDGANAATEGDYSAPTPIPTANAYNGNSDRNNGANDDENDATTPSDLFTDTGVTGAVPCPVPLHTAQSLPGKKGIVIQPDQFDRIHLAHLFELDPYWNHYQPDFDSQGYIGITPPPRNQPNLIEFLPTLNSKVDLDNPTEISTAVAAFLSEAKSAPPHILGFHHPDEILDEQQEVATEGVDEEDDENRKTEVLPVKKALEYWTRLEQELPPTVALVSPTTAGDPTDHWMRKFMRKADESCLRVDWIGIRLVVSNRLSVVEFKTKLAQVHSLYGGQRPLLITELDIDDQETAAANRGVSEPLTQVDVLDFVKEILPWLEAQTWIVGYAWSVASLNIGDTRDGSRTGTTGAARINDENNENRAPIRTRQRPSALFDASTGQLTAVGRYYASVRHDRPQGNQSITV